MRRETRHSAATLLVGVLATLGALTLLDQLRRRQCEGAGGAWDAVARACTADGQPVAIALGGARGYALAGAVALLLAFMLWRLFTFGTRPR